MTYKEAIEYIEHLKNFGITPGLATIRELCRRLENPQEKLKFIHIAGTNGKGSVLSFISTILRAACYRVGRFFSPAISEYRERIQINNRIITKQDFGRYIDKVRRAADSMVADGLAHPTAYEVDTALAFLYFAEENCEIVVLETGMGGLFDATNIIENTLVAVITPIGLDHQKFLGQTHAEIASHKAGIIKNGAQVISAGQREDVEKIIAEKASEAGCLLSISPLGQLEHIKQAKPDVKNLIFKQYFRYGELADLTISLAGEFQIMNAILALDAVTLLSRQGFPICEKHIRKGLSEAAWPGRFQMISGKPPFIIDGAHNALAALKLAETLKIYFTNKRIIYIMGILRDKDYQEIIANTCELAEHIITITPPDPRALSGYDLALEIAKWHPQVTSADSIIEACELAALLAGKEGIIVAFGSMTILDAIRKCVRESK